MLPHLQYQNLRVSRRQPHLNFIPSAFLVSSWRNHRKGAITASPGLQNGGSLT